MQRLVQPYSIRRSALSLVKPSQRRERLPPTPPHRAPPRSVYEARDRVVLALAARELHAYHIYEYHNHNHNSLKINDYT